MRPNTKQHGFTLIEILVAVLVLSVGLLGIAGLQTKGTQHVYDAQLHTLAAIQVQDMADRIRANLEGMRDGRYNALSTTPPTNPSCDSDTCTPEQLAAYDMYRWNTDNGALLPSGAGQIACEDTSGTTLSNGTNADIGSRCTITVRWDANRNGATGLGCDPAKDTDLRCVRLSIVP